MEHCRWCRSIHHTIRKCPKVRCKNCHDIGHMHLDCPRELHETLEVCGYCSIVGHTKEQCKTRVICEKCGVRGHDASVCGAGCESCRERGFKDAERHSQLRCPRAETRCEHCGKTNHITERCWFLRECGKCGRLGHATQRCIAYCRFCQIAGFVDYASHAPRACVRFPLVCDNCHCPGHKASECTEIYHCSECGDAGHTASFCRRRRECNFCRESEALREHASTHNTWDCGHLKAMNNSHH